MNFQNSTSMMPDQVRALTGLLNETGGFAIEVAPDAQMGVRVVVFTRESDSPDEDTQAVGARWFTISVAGTVRELAPDPVEVAA